MAKQNNKKDAEESSLYADVGVSLGSVFLFGAIAYYLWLPNLVEELNAAPYVVEMTKSALLHVYVPFVAVCFILGELTKNFSQVDKIWSVITPVFAWYITIYDAGHHGMLFNYKLVLMSCLVTVWGARLTYQFYRKGGYSWKFWTGEEDYRWETVRERMPVMFENRLLFSLFNFGFICCYQLFLLFMITCGVMIATVLSDGDARQHDTLSPSQIAIAVTMFLLIVMEVVSDYHQQCFQVEKYRRLKEGIPLRCAQNHYEIGFNVNGLFAYSRHPNFTAEQLIWVAFYLFSVNLNKHVAVFKIGGLLNVATIGPILLIIVFAKSTDLTESISAHKYPLYGKYQRNVSRILDVKLVARKLLLGESPKTNWLN